MTKQSDNTLNSSLPNAQKVKTPEDLGNYVRHQRNLQNMSQADIVGLANIGNRFIVDLEKGKPTIQLQKVLDVIDLLGLEIIIQKKKM